MRKYIPYLCVLVTVIIITISILYNKDKEEDSFIYFYNSYNLSSSVTEEDFLNINIYVNNKKTYFVDKNQISTCYIEGGEDIINLDIINISSNNENIVYKNNEYYCFNFKFKLFFDTANFTTWFLKDVNLIINYNNDKEYVLKIGDISINKLEDNIENISLSVIKPLVSNISKNTYLTGLIIGLRKTTSQNIKINKIKLLDANLSIGNRIEKLDDLPNTNKFDDVASYNYLSINKGSEDFNIKLTDNVIYIFIPIYYEKMTLANNFPILFELLVDDNIENYVLSDYIFYEPSNFIINDNEILNSKIK